MLFTIIMKYMNMVMVKMQADLNFNHHSKCQKFGIIHLTFAGDVLLFSRGDILSLELILQAFHKFSESTGLSVNPKKCKIFYSGMK